MAYDLGTAKGTIELEYEGKREVDKAEKDMDRAARKSEDTDKSLRRLGATLNGLFSGAKFGALALGMSQAAVGAANLVTQLLGVVPQLASISSLAAALPGLFVGIGAAIGTIKAITAGVGDTIKAAFDPEGAAKFAKGLEQLAPAAQQFANAVKDAAPALRGLQQDLQQAFFQASFLAQQVPRLGKALDALKPTLVGLAGDFGEITRQVTNFALSADSITFIQNAVKATRASFSEASSAILPLLKGLRDVGAVGLPLLTRLGELAGTVGTKFGTWLSQIASSGQLQEFINTAISTLKTLGNIAQNVGVILRSIFQAAGETSGGLLGNIEKITGAFAEFLDSATGMNALRSLFAGVGQAAAALAPVLTTLVGALAGALGPALQQLAQVLGPALLQVVNALAPAFAPLAQGLVDVLSAIEPLAPPFAKLIAMLAQLAGGILSTVAAEMGPLIELFSGGLMQVLEQLAPVIQEALVKGLPLAAKAGQALLEAFQPLIPVIVQFAEVLGQSLMDNLPELLALAEELIPVFSELASALAGQLGEALLQITPYIPDIVHALVMFAKVSFEVQSAIFRVEAAFLRLSTSIGSVPGRIGQVFGAIKNFFVSGFNAVREFVSSAVDGVVNFFSALPSRIGAALAALPGLLLALFKRALETAATVIGTAAGLIVGIFTKLPARIAQGLIALGPVLASLFSSAMDKIKAAVTAGVTAVINFFRTSVTRVRSALSNLGPTLSALGSAALAKLKTAVSNGITNTINFFRNLPSRIKSALGNLGSLLFNAGANIVRGIYNGIVSQAGRVLDYVRGLADRVKNAFNNALDIFSPSKVFIESGVNIDEGLIAGLRKKLGAVKSAAVDLANTVVAPTLSLPPSAAMAFAGVPGPTPPSSPQASAPGSGGEFGPYMLMLDGKVVSSFVVDAISGNPRVVSKAADAGKQLTSWVGSGRKAS
jgi:phage-related protein